MCLNLVNVPSVNLKKKHSVRVAGFIWDNMRTVAQEIAPQIALRNCPEEAGEKGQYMCDFGEGEDMQPSTYLSRFLPVL